MKRNTYIHLKTLRHTNMEIFNYNIRAVLPCASKCICTIMNNSVKTWQTSFLCVLLMCCCNFIFPLYNFHVIFYDFVDTVGR